ILLAGCGFHRPPAEAVGTPQQLALGEERTCAVFAPDDVRCWGARATGTSDDNDLLPRHLPELKNVGSLSLSVGYDCAILENGSVACWGDHPSEWVGLAGVHHLQTYINRGCAATEDGTLYCGDTFNTVAKVTTLSNVSATALAFDRS